MTVIAPISTSLTAESPQPQAPLSDRFLLAQVQSFTLVIPALWVVEIFRAERSQILSLPFYSPLLLGLTHHGGRVLPLLSTHSLLNAPNAPLRTLHENAMVVNLGDQAGTLAQVGFVIDRPLGSQTRAELPSTVFSNASQQSDSCLVLLRPELVSPDLWQPLIWIPSGL